MAERTRRVRPMSTRWIDGVAHLHCSSCEAWLPTSSFARRRASHNGFNASCRTCIAERKAFAYARDRETVRARRHARYWEDPERARAGKRMDHAKHREERNARRRVEYEQSTKSEEFLRRRREARQRHEAKKMGVTLVEIAAKIAYWGDRCWICGDPWEHLDHVKPRAAGGPHLLANIRPACRPCNQRKNAIWPFATDRSLKWVPVPVAIRALNDVPEGCPFDMKLVPILIRRYIHAC